MSLNEQLGHRLDQAQNLANLAAISFQRGEFDQALKQLEVAAHMLGEARHRPYEAIARLNISKVQSRMGRMDEAEEHCSVSLAINRQIGNRIGQAEGLVQLGTIALRRCNHQAAKEYLAEARRIYEESGVEVPENTRRRMEFPREMEEMERRQRESGEEKT